MNKSIKLGVVGTAVVGLTLASSVSVDTAGAWVHPWGHGEGAPFPTYYMPGGAEDSYLNGCIVHTRLAKFPQGDRARLVVDQGNRDGLESHCILEHLHFNISVVTYDGATLQGPRFLELYGPFHYPTYSTAGKDSVGHYGQGIFGAHVSASSWTGVYKSWAITIM
jgi:hypothetical protein